MTFQQRLNERGEQMYELGKKRVRLTELKEAQEENERLRRMIEQDCEHKCHKVGLNAWVERCPVCGCRNKDFSPLR